MKVIFVIWPNLTNPYVELLTEAMKGQKRDVEIFHYSPELLKKFIKNKEKFILHIHWPAVCYSRSKFLMAATKTLDFLWAIKSAKKRKLIKIIWTFHDYASHNSPYPIIDKFLFSKLCHFTDNFVVHTDAGRVFLNKKNVSNEKISIIPHGNYIDYYGLVESKNESRAKLNIPINFKIFLNIGMIFPYKGLDKLISIFKSQIYPEFEKTKLIIAGESYFQSYSDYLKSLAVDSNINILDYFIKTEKIATFLSAADFFIMAHKNFLTSGAAILALSYGLPVIAPNCGDMLHVIKHGFNGFLYEQNDEKALINVIKKAIKKTDEERKIMAQNAINSVKNWTWDNMAKEILKIYDL